MNAKWTWDRSVGLAGLALLALGTTMGVFFAPVERYMGVSQKIMYVHVPSAWIAMVAFTAALVFAIASLWTGRAKWDAAMTGSIEVGVVLNGLLLVQGMIWGKATWGVWWDWDVRLTTSLVMFLLFAGILALRSFVEESDRRAAWSAVATIVAYVDVPLVYFCVRWWRSLHQMQSSPDTVDSALSLPLQINAVAMLLFAAWLAAKRARIELERAKSDLVAEPVRLVPEREPAEA